MKHGFRMIFSAAALAVLCACEVPTASFEPPKFEPDEALRDQYAGTWEARDKDTTRTLVIAKYELPDAVKKTPDETKDIRRKIFNASFRLKVEDVRPDKMDGLNSSDWVPMAGFFFQTGGKQYMCVTWDILDYAAGRYDLSSAMFLAQMKYYIAEFHQVPGGLLQVDYVTFMKKEKSADGKKEKLVPVDPALPLCRDTFFTGTGEELAKAVSAGKYVRLNCGTFKKVK